METGGRKGDGEDEDRGNGPLPGARVLPSPRYNGVSVTLNRDGGAGDRGGRGKGSLTFVHVRLKFSVGFQ